MLNVKSAGQIQTKTMIIQPIDSKNNLFYVEDVYPQSLIDAISTYDFTSTPYEKVEWQEHMPRRKLKFNEDNVLAQLNVCNESNLDLISKAININLMHSGTAVWLDEPGFSMGIHEDNLGVTIAMQVYLNYNDTNLGTKFYHKNNINSLRYDFPYKLNAGYIMINESGQWHGIPNKVPNSSWRISSYTYLK